MTAVRRRGCASALSGTPHSESRLAIRMQVTVKLFATFRTGRFDVAQMEHPPGTTVGGIVDALGIAREEIGILMVSGRHAEVDDRPAPGDTVAIFPLVGGG